jgi:hypothetical protein
VNDYFIDKSSSSKSDAFCIILFLLPRYTYEYADDIKVLSHVCTLLVYSHKYINIRPNEIDLCIV